jgi:hypothetical protein
MMIYLNVVRRAQAAGAFDSWVPTDAFGVFRNMSTPRSGGLGPVNLSVPLNELHTFELG